MLPFLGCRGGNSSNQRKGGKCNQTKHREDYARLGQIANRNLWPHRNVSLDWQKSFASHDESCSSPHRSVWRGRVLAISTPAKSWIRVGIPRLKSMCVWKAELSVERPFPAGRAQAKMKPWNCAMTTKTASAAEA